MPFLGVFHKTGPLNQAAIWRKNMVFIVETVNNLTTIDMQCPKSEFKESKPTLHVRVINSAKLYN